MKEIFLADGRKTLVDDEDFEWLKIYLWWATERGYVMRSEGPRNDQRFIRMDFEILKKHNIQLKAEIDHKDRNPLNNQKSNLRACIKIENMANRGVSKANTSGFKGVSFDNKTKRWRAAIKYKGTNRHLGFYDTPEKAAREYDNVAKSLHGEFAFLNFPEKKDERKI